MAEFGDRGAVTPAELRACGDDLLTALLGVSKERIALSTGYRYRFEDAPGLVTRIGTVLEWARERCPFFRLQVALEPEQGPITLDISGPEDARAFLADLEQARARRNAPDDPAPGWPVQ